MVDEALFTACEEASDDGGVGVNYIKQLYINSCYLEGIYSLLDNMTDEYMLLYLGSGEIVYPNDKVREMVTLLEVPEEV